MKNNLTLRKFVFRKTLADSWPYMIVLFLMYGFSFFLLFFWNTSYVKDSGKLDYLQSLESSFSIAMLVFPVMTVVASVWYCYRMYCGWKYDIARFVMRGYRKFACLQLCYISVFFSFLVTYFLAFGGSFLAGYVFKVCANIKGSGFLEVRSAFKIFLVSSSLSFLVSSVLFFTVPFTKKRILKTIRELY